MKKVKTSKFKLRKLKKSDANDIARNINNWNVIKFLSQLPFPYEFRHAKQFTARIEREMKKAEPQNYLLVIEIDGEVVGAIGAHHIASGHKAEMGYWLAEQHWGRGIMTEAVKKFMAQVFAEFKLRRIYAYAYANNKASARVLEKVGMKFEGLHRKQALKDGKFIDCRVYAKVK